MKNKTLGELGACGTDLYQCPLCKRSGYSMAGLKNHRCPALPRRDGKRVRLEPETIDQIVAAGPIKTK